MAGDERASRWLTQRARAFGPSVIQEISLLSQKCNAINLGEGFPDFPAPPEVKEAAVAAIRSDCNQYRYVQALCDRVAARFTAMTGVSVDSNSQVALCCGQTAAMACALLAVVEAGDEVILLDPSFETYPAGVIAAGGTPKYVQLRPPLWALDRRQLEAAIGPRTKALVLNSPTNPTGKVFTRAELEAVASVCVEHDLLAITDEVYEQLIYDDVPHVSLASLPNMRERTIVTSSMSKTFSVTGWRVGWAIAPAAICAAIANLHVKINDSPPAPFQEAALTALSLPATYYSLLREEYTRRQELTCRIVRSLGLLVHQQPRGGMFIFAEIPAQWDVEDVRYVSDLVTSAGVAFVPGCIFFHDSAEQQEQQEQACSCSKHPGPHRSEGRSTGEAHAACDSCGTSSRRGGAKDDSERQQNGLQNAPTSCQVRRVDGGSEGEARTCGSASAPLGGERGFAAMEDKAGATPAVCVDGCPHKGEERRVSAGQLHYTKRYVRVAFCKKMETLVAAGKALEEVKKKVHIHV